MAAETELERMVVRLVGDAQQYQTMLRQAAADTRRAADDIERHTSKFGKLAGAIKNYGAVAAGALAAVGVAFGFKKSFDAFAEAEGISLKLNAALEANGRNAKVVRADYEDFAKALARVTTAEDDTTLKMLQQAESLGLTDVAAKRAVKNAVALAAAKGGEAEGYLRVTTALEQGSTEMLGRFLPAIRSIEDPTKRAAAAQEMLAKMFGTAKAEAQSSAGRMTQLKNEFGNLMEEVGGVIADIAKPLVGGLRNAVGATQEWLDSVGGLAGLWDKAKDAALAAWEWMTPVRDSLRSLWGTISEGASTAWESAKTFALSAWDSINIGAVVSWESIRDAIADALLFAEFTLQNFGQVAELVWTETKLGAVKFGNQVEYFFREVLPATAKWFSEEWRNIFTDIFEFTKTVFTNLGSNIANIIKNIPELIKGNVSLADLWTPLTEGFQRASKELVLPERVKGDLEKQLEQLASEQEAALSKSFDAFKESKKAQFEAEKAIPQEEIVEAEEKALELGTTLTDAFKPAQKEAAKLAEKYDAVQSGSADALQRIERFREALSREEKKAKVPEDGRREAVQRTSADAGQRQQKQVDELKNANKFLQKLVDKPTLTVEPASFG